MKNFEISDNTTIVDVGCGTGRHVLLLAELTKAKVVGCDFVPENIEFINKLIGQMGLYNASGVFSDATEFSEHVGVDSCDLVIAIGVIQYLTNQDQLNRFSNSCSEILLSGGSLILKHPLSFTESFLLDYHRDDMDTRYISKYYNLPDIMQFFKDKFELMKIERTFTRELTGEHLEEIERDHRARQMWIHLEKK